MRKVVIFFMFAVVAFSCNNPSEYTVTGIIENAAGKELVLSEMTTSSPVEIGKVVVEEDGSFEIKGELTTEKFHFLSGSTNDNITLLLGPGSEISVTGDYNDLRRTYTVSNSYENEMILKLDRRLSITDVVLDSLAVHYNNLLDENEDDVMNIRQQFYKSYMTELQLQRNFNLEFIRVSPGSYAAFYALFQQLESQKYVLTPDRDLPFFKLVKDSLSSSYPESVYINVVDKFITTYEKKLSVTKLQKAIDEAKEVFCPNFKSFTAEGDTVRFESFRGKYVLLSFWASWNISSREVNPAYVNAYKQFGGDNFEICQVSLDRTKSAWQRAIVEDGLGDWTHLSDLEYWNSQAATAYNIKSLPVNFILDPEGRIIGRDLYGGDLIAKLKELLKK